MGNAIRKKSDSKAPEVAENVVVSPDESGVVPSHRRMARKILVQALYTAEISERPLAEIKNLGLVAPADVERADDLYMEDAWQGLQAHCDEVEALVASQSTRPAENIGLCERVILRLAAWELIYRKDVLPVVVVDEAIRLARQFADAPGYRFVNGVADAMLKQVKEGTPVAGEGAGRWLDGEEPETVEPEPSFSTDDAMLKQAKEGTPVAGEDVDEADSAEPETIEPEQSLSTSVATLKQAKEETPVASEGVDGADGGEPEESKATKPRSSPGASSAVKEKTQVAGKGQAEVRRRRRLKP